MEASAKLPVNQMSGELLSRVDLITILNDRHLKIPNMESLSYEELLRIYTTFACPLDKRETKRMSVSPDLTGISPNSDRPPAEDLKAEQAVLNEHFTYPGPHLLQQAKYLKLAFNTIANQAKKRHHDSGMNVIQEGSPAKRTPVGWP